MSLANAHMTMSGATRKDFGKLPFFPERFALGKVFFINFHFSGTLDTGGVISGGGIEPGCPVWQAGVLSAILHGRMTIVSCDLGSRPRFTCKQELRSLNPRSLIPRQVRSRGVRMRSGKWPRI